MEINKLVDLDNFRTAPRLSYIQEKKLLQHYSQLLKNILQLNLGN